MGSPLENKSDEKALCGVWTQSFISFRSEPKKKNLSWTQRKREGEEGERRSERERERARARRTRSSAFNKKYMRKILGNSSKRNNKQRTCGGSWVFYQEI